MQLPVFTDFIVMEIYGNASAKATEMCTYVIIQYRVYVELLGATDNVLDFYSRKML